MIPRAEQTHRDQCQAPFATFNAKQEGDSHRRQPHRGTVIIIDHKTLDMDFSNSLLDVKFTLSIPHQNGKCYRVVFLGAFLLFRPPLNE